MLSFDYSVEQRNESYFREWPPKPVDQEEEIVQRDPRLFPIRTPQPPRKQRPALAQSTFNLNNQWMDNEEWPEFQRSNSARLRSKTPTRGLFSDQSKRQEQRDESMRRLFEWKQRMLQSPLSRKGSRAQTPVMMQGNNSSSNTADLSPKLHQRVARKTSSASRTSRTRSLSRLSNRLSTSSSDEGKNY